MQSSVEARTGLRPEGSALSSNVDTNEPSELVEFTTKGTFVAQLSVDPNPGGAFAIAFGDFNGKFGFAAVDDNTNTLDVWTVPATVRPWATSILDTLITPLVGSWWF